MAKIILGSQSPRRCEILSFFSIPFRQVSSDFDEALIAFDTDPGTHSCDIARAKAKILSEQYPDKIILTADTVVYFQGRSLEKPKDLVHARNMLRELSGQWHEVHTGVCVATGDHFFSDSECTRVLFTELTDNEIDTYIQKFHTLDKAGGYAIQQAGSLIVKRIEGCYYNVMGLPLQTVRRLLKQASRIDLWDYFKSV